MKAIASSIQSEGYFRRMWIYLQEMYSFPKHLVSAILIYLSFTFMLSHNYGIRAPFPSLYTLIGAASLFLFLLILRLMDELKDREVDLELFQHRPVPSGRVYEADIRLSLSVVTALFVALNALGGISFWMSLVLLGYSVLMFKYFFIPETLRKNLILNLISHNPVVALIFLYLVVLFAAEHQIPLHQMNWKVSVLLCLMYWSMCFAWEISRKIRSAAEENAYVTYSQLFGKLGSVTIAAAAQNLTFALAVFFAQVRSLSLLYVLICSAGYCAAMFAHTRFLVNPNRVTSQLKPWAEAYMMSIALAGCCEALIEGGPQ